MFFEIYIAWKLWKSNVASTHFLPLVFHPCAFKIKSIYKPPILGNDLKKELNKCSVLYDLPKAHALRTNLVAAKEAMENVVER